jgi:hypothetical protein
VDCLYEIALHNELLLQELSQELQAPMFEEAFRNRVIKCELVALLHRYKLERSTSINRAAGVMQVCAHPAAHVRV